MSESITIGGQLVPVPFELREAPDYRAAVAAWHKAELESRSLPHALLPGPEVAHAVELAPGLTTIVKGGHRGPKVWDAEAPIEVPLEAGSDPLAWVLQQRVAAARRERDALLAREGLSTVRVDPTTGHRRAGGAE